MVIKVTCSCSQYPKLRVEIGTDKSLLVECLKCGETKRFNPAEEINKSLMPKEKSK